ncbi:hypothetical protein GOV03_00690 [Candidatus Woesearchaeota archaeon]|nr:hypothetical protein [Candidatus Woesearchaeota archaeon]
MSQSLITLAFSLEQLITYVSVQFFPATSHLVAPAFSILFNRKYKCYNGTYFKAVGYPMKKINLKYLIENECFITCQPLSTDRFVSYCKELGIHTSKEHLEQFEKLGIFYPIAVETNLGVCYNGLL